MSSTGQLTYTTFQPAPRRLTWFDRTGQALGDLGPPGLYRMLMLSPNGRRFAATRLDTGTDNPEIIEIDLANQAIEKMMPGRPVSHAYAVWAPDSNHMAYMSRPQSRFEVVRGSMHESETEVLARSPGLLIPFDWSADGRLLLCVTYDAATKFDIGAIPLGGTDRTLIADRQEPLQRRDAPPVAGSAVAGVLAPTRAAASRSTCSAFRARRRNGRCRRTAASSRPGAPMDVSCSSCPLICG